jgi:4-amino-4-deoxy-L-arabinose transferase-like glycosyltransferase
MMQTVEHPDHQEEQPATQMDTPTPSGVRSLSRRGVVLLLFLLALATRAWAPGDFWTADEAEHWSTRVDAFLPAIQQGDYAETNMVGHPGVTTMWLGTFGVLVQEGLERLGWIAPDNPALYRLFLRLPVAFVTALCIALAYPLARRLFGDRLSLLATLFWIGDPFLVAHSKVLHVDALLTSFILLSLLAALVAFRLTPDDTPDDVSEDGIRWGMVAASAVAGGLALLTKSPSLILPPMLGLIALVGLLPLWSKNRFGMITRLTLALALWGAIAAAVWVALWPAAWVDPIGSAKTIINEILDNGARPHVWGNFFMGEVFRAEGPGRLYYPVALVLRLTPWAMVGILLAGGTILLQLISPNQTAPTTPTPTMGQRLRSLWHRPSLTGGTSPALALLLVFALLFFAIMSIPPKKFDRYLLPIVPVLDLVAALGWLWLTERVWRVWQTRFLPATSRPPTPYVVGGWSLVISILLVNLAWYHPYEMAYYNPLLGGGPAAARAIYVGWGEGLEQAGHYITRQHNGCELGVASWYEYVIRPYVCSPVLHLGYLAVPGHVHYGVLYINQIQRNIKADIFPHLRKRGALVHTVRIHGIDYAYVYQMRQPRQHTIAATFGPAVQLMGYDVDPSAVRSSGILTLTLQWQTQQEMDHNYALFVHVFDETGAQVGQTDVPPGGPFQPTSKWESNRYIDWIHRVPVWGERSETEQLYVTLGLYDSETRKRLPLSIQHRPDQPEPPAIDDGANALLLNPIALPPL